MKDKTLKVAAACLPYRFFSFLKRRQTVSYCIAPRSNIICAVFYRRSKPTWTKGAIRTNASSCVALIYRPFWRRASINIARRYSFFVLFLSLWLRTTRTDERTIDRTKNGMHALEYEADNNLVFYKKICCARYRSNHHHHRQRASPSVVSCLRRNLQSNHHH